MDEMSQHQAQIVLAIIILVMGVLALFTWYFWGLDSLSALLISVSWNI